MASRRTNRFSPSRDDLSRRLFDSPPPVHRGRRLDDAFRIPKKSFVAFVALGSIFLLMIHAYLFSVLFRDSGARVDETLAAPHLTKAMQDGDRRVPLQKKDLQPLKEQDSNQYTIRINTWQRNEQLLVSVDWHSQCPGVAQIQIVWCDKENDPPSELLEYEKVVIERHDVNTLNERFNILHPTPTLGILSIDDDVLRPCESIDAGFFLWTQSPDRMVGFDGRLHVENDNGSWKYGYMSTTEKANKYSMSLTRYCFLHRDYFDIYMLELPISILDPVAQNFNCEDIAMSFLVSSLTDGKPPLLADTWAIKSMVKLYVEKKISGNNDHKQLRDGCVDSFAEILGLKSGERKLRPATMFHKKNPQFEAGDRPTTTATSHEIPIRQTQLDNMKATWLKDGKLMRQDLHHLMSKTGVRAYQQGLIQNSDRWKDRFEPPREGGD